MKIKTFIILLTAATKKLPAQQPDNYISPTLAPNSIKNNKPKNTKRLPRSMRTGVSAAQPRRSAAAAVLSAVEQEPAICSPPAVFAAASASAPPIMPAPIKPA